MFGLENNGRYSLNEKILEERLNEIIGILRIKKYKIRWVYLILG